MTNPMTTLGDMIYGASGGAPTRLAGNTSTVKQHLTSTGNGSAAAAPLWSNLNADVLAAMSTAGVTTIAYAATINIDMTTITTPVARIALTGPATINFTGGTDGQKLTLELAQDATGGRVVTLGTGVAYGSDIASYSGNTGASKTDILGFQYFSGTSKARLVAVAKGY
jgi:hypothetical protein